MPSSSFISAQPSRQRQVFDPRTGKQVPFAPYGTVGQRMPKLYRITKVRKLNPFLINGNHFSHY